MVLCLRSVEAMPTFQFFKNNSMVAMVTGADQGKLLENVAKFQN